mgnify:CR=1 FL=1
MIALILYGVNAELFDKVEYGRIRDMGKNLVLILLGIWVMKFYLGFVDRQEVGAKRMRYV